MTSREIASVKVTRPRGTLSNVRKPYIIAFVGDDLQCSPGLAKRRLYGTSRIERSWYTKNDTQLIIFEEDHRPSGRLMQDEVNFEITVSVNEQNKSWGVSPLTFTRWIYSTAHVSPPPVSQFKGCDNHTDSHKYFPEAFIYVMQIFSLSKKLFSRLEI